MEAGLALRFGIYVGKVTPSIYTDIYAVSSKNIFDVLGSESMLLLCLFCL